MTENAGRIRIAPELLVEWLDLPPGHAIRWAEASTRPDGTLDTIDLIVTGPAMPPAPAPGERAQEVTPVFRRRSHELVEIQPPRGQS